MQQDGPADIQKRLPLLAAFIVLFAVVLFFRLWYLQVVKGATYQELAESNRIRPIKIRPPRGIIYDRHGRPMVENALTFDISIVPEDAPDLEDSIARLASIVKMRPEAIHGLDSNGRQSPYAASTSRSRSRKRPPGTRSPWRKPGRTTCPASSWSPNIAGTIPTAAWRLTSSATSAK
jgi:cell division protein FtsI/penicillin-binding protein 2